MPSDEAARRHDAMRPWLAHYDVGQPAGIAVEFSDMLALFEATVARGADRPALLYFDGRLTYAEIDALSDRLAAHLADRGFAPGDRLAIYLQNVPAYLVALVAAWKAGGIAVAVSPMSRERELALLFEDCTPAALVCHASLYEQVVAKTDAPLPRIVLTTSRLDLQTRDDPRLFADATRTPTAMPDLMATLAARPQAPPPARPRLAPDHPALLVYTSGTTGKPKGAILTHANIVHNAQVYRDWMRLEPHEPILALAPLFHITGLVAHIAVALLTAAPLVLTYRFHPDVMLDAIEEHRPVFTIGAITAFIALLNAPGASRERVASLRTVASGGAAIPRTIVEKLSARLGFEITPAYGLTETTSPCHLAPLDQPTRVDEATGLLSIGLPVFGTDAWIAADDGTRAPVGEAGEIVVIGPMVAPGYWRQPEATAEAMRPDGFRTGDIGFMDADGWFFVIDRKKDMINAGGYKVWPREVEDVIYAHPAVREAAVVGVPDEYRGETVKAVVSLDPGQGLTADALIAWCRPRMAAYKVPRLVDIVDELPKTPTGKILRRMLR